VSTSLIDEVKAEYIKVIKKLQVNGIVKPIPNPNTQKLVETPKEEPLIKASVYFLSIQFLLEILNSVLLFFCSVGGKTKNYSLFLKRKNLLRKRLHSTHPTTINILYFTKRQVPKTMINAESYK